MDLLTLAGWWFSLARSGWLKLSHWGQEKTLNICWSDYLRWTSLPVGHWEWLMSDIRHFRPSSAKTRRHQSQIKSEDNKNISKSEIIFLSPSWRPGRCWWGKTKQIATQWESGVECLAAWWAYKWLPHRRRRDLLLVPTSHQTEHFNQLEISFLSLRQTRAFLSDIQASLKGLDIVNKRI